MDDSLRIPNPTIPKDFYDGLIQAQEESTDTPIELLDYSDIVAVPRYIGDRLLLVADGAKNLFIGLGTTDSNDWHLIYMEET